MNEVITAVVPGRQCKVVSDPAIARKLLRDGYKIVDIKPKKKFPRESAFVFESVNGFDKAYDKYMQERKNNKTEE